mmetsp:Transcript_22582/g.27864  ORF Transcript_22582/g.27864 Transcript_22582/m.27864 type:complete len:146 (+) Transcript_22582:68-505(+)
MKPSIILSQQTGAATEAHEHDSSMRSLADDCLDEIENWAPSPKYNNTSTRHGVPHIESGKQFAPIDVRNESNIKIEGNLHTDPSTVNVILESLDFICSGANATTRCHNGIMDQSSVHQQEEHEPMSFGRCQVDQRAILNVITETA